MQFMSRVFSNTTSLLTSVCMLYVGAVADSSYLSYYADKLLKLENQSSLCWKIFSEACAVALVGLNTRYLS